MSIDTTEARPRLVRRPFPILAAIAGAAAVGFLAGGQSDDARIERSDEARIAAKDPVPIIIQPPAFAVPKDGFAIIGAENGQYYIVTQTGSRELFYPDNRRFMFWR